MRIAIGSDHAGYAMKAFLIKHLEGKGLEVHDFGPSSEDRVDYPDFAHPLAQSVSEGKEDMGILLCGSGNGIGMAANKHKGIRAALCWNAEVASLARAHNDANILALPSRFITDREAAEITDAFLSTSFEGGRHIQRVKKIPLNP